MLNYRDKLDSFRPFSGPSITALIDSRRKSVAARAITLSVLAGEQLEEGILEAIDQLKLRVPSLDVQPDAYAHEKGKSDDFIVYTQSLSLTLPMEPKDILKYQPLETRYVSGLGSTVVNNGEVVIRSGELRVGDLSNGKERISRSVKGEISARKVAFEDQLKSLSRTVEKFNDGLEGMLRSEIERRRTQHGDADEVLSLIAK